MERRPRDYVSTALIALVITTGCGDKKKKQEAAPAPPTPVAVVSDAAAPAAPTTKPTRLVAVQGKTARIIEVDSTSAKVVSTSTLPQMPMAVVWAGVDPIVLFATSESAIPGTEGDPKLEGRVGAITSSGLKLLPELPASTWTLPKPNDDAEDIGPRWELHATTTGETWLGRCAWGGIEDGGHCEERIYARIGGAFALSARTLPPDVGGYDWAAAPPAPGYSITFGQGDDESHSKIVCKGGGVELTLPNEEHPDAWSKESGVKWISTDPPMFIATQTFDGLVGWFEEKVFEGCAWSKKFDGAKLYGGPDDTLVIANATTMSIRHQGRELASLPGAELVAFAPEEPDTRSAFAILERQLAGDMLMFYNGSQAMMSGPILKPGAVKSARITTFEATQLGDATAVAAEVEIAGEGTLRTVQLIDNGHVVAESFAPPKPFSPPMTALQQLEVTPVGPLGAFLTSPRSAAAALDSHAVVFGTDANERGVDKASSKQLLERWGKLALTLDPNFREVRTATSGYALGTVTLAKKGGGSLRMGAVIIGKPDGKSWKVVALHYLPL